MKKIFHIFCLGMVLLAATGSVSHGQDVESLTFPELNKINIPDIEQVTLDNGMRVYLLEDKSLPVVSARARINCGSYLETEDKIGLADIFGMVMRTGGTEKWAGDEIDEMLEGIGATVETNIGTTAGSAYMNVLSEYTDLGLEVLAEILRRPVFDEDKINLAKMQIRTGISRRNDQIAQISQREFNKLIYGAGSPYARHPEYATIDAITRNDLVNFHMAYFHPENVQLAVWGDFNKKDMLKKIDRFFGFWEAVNLPVPSPPPVDYQWRSKVYYIEKTDVEQAYIRVGHIGGLITDDDYADRIVMNSILGGGFGSRITDAVRTKLGLAYSTRGSYGSQFYPGTFFAMASTKPSSAIKATREMIKQIKSMQTDPPTENEMKKGKDGYLNSFVFNFDSRSEIINRMMTYDYYGLPTDFLQKEKEKVEKVTPQAVQQAAIKSLRPDQMIVLVVGNAAEFEEPLDSLGLGPVDTIDITIPTAEQAQQTEVSDDNLEKATALLSKVIEVSGGLENFKKVRSVKMTSKIFLDPSNRETFVDHESILVFPDKKRNVITMAGMPLYDILAGDSGWMSSQMGTIEPMKEKQLIEAKKSLARDFINIFAHADNPYYQATYGGPDVIEETPIEYISIVDLEGNPICRLGIGNDGQLVCLTYYGQTAFGPGITEEVFSNRVENEGILIPMDIKRIMNGTEFGSETFTEVLINPEVPPDSFGKPE